jgi:hypothetical protein
MPIKLRPLESTSQNRLWTAEVTPPEGGGLPLRSTGPMTVGDLIAALKTTGCNQADIDNALREAMARYSQAFKDERAEQDYGPRLRAALAGEQEVAPQRPFIEPWIAYALFLDQAPASLASVLDTADFIDHLVPTPDEIAWAFVRLRRRGWLAVEANLYGLTAEGTRGIAVIIGEDGDRLDKINRLEAWASAHPP